MSILNVEHLTHGFGDRAIFNDVSFRLLKGEHIGLIGANGEGKSTFMNIITGKLMPDEGKVEWAKNVRVGYLDQHTVLTPGMTIRQVLASAFDFLYDMEAQMNEICDKMGDATPKELEQYMEDLGTIQDLLTMHDFYMRFAPQVIEASGSGAGDGMGAGLLAFASGKIVSGIDYVLDLLEFDKRVQQADLVIVGEGRLDGQSLKGKAPVGIARRVPEGVPVCW